MIVVACSSFFSIVVENPRSRILERERVGGKSWREMRERERERREKERERSFELGEVSLLHRLVLKRKCP